MRDTHELSQSSRRLPLLLIGGGLVLVLLLAIGIYGLLRGPAIAPRSDGGPAEAPTHEARDFAPRPLTPNRDAEHYASQVATQMFAWDTATGRMPVEYMQPLIDAADPEEAPGLASDLRGYFPDDAVWGELRAYSTRQWLAVQSVTVPEGWEGIVTQAALGLVPAGAVAYTVTGTRHRDGVWDGARVSESWPVVFTIFAACPEQEACRLLRISKIDHPLR